MLYNEVKLIKRRIFMKLLIVRHGDPDYSIDSLTETGWIEARLLADRLSKLDVKAFYCSPLGRAKDTAKPTLERLGREAEIFPWLREFPPHVKKPDGHGKVAWDWLPEDWTVRDYFYDRNDWSDAPEFQEGNVREAYEAVCQGLDDLIARHGYRREGNLYRVEQPNMDTIVLFCHFGLECVLLSHLLNCSPMIFWHGSCAAPTSVTTLITEERREGKSYWRMGAFGDTSHLYVAGRSPSFSARFCEMYTNEEERHD